MKNGGSLFEKNLRCIRECFPGLAEQLEKNRGGTRTETGMGGGGWDGGEGDIVIGTSASAEKDMIILGRHVHSPRDPVRESRRLAESLRGGGPIVVLGFGLGYEAEAAAALRPDRPLIIVERHESVLRKSLECRDLSSFLGSPGIVFVLGGSGGGLAGALKLFEERQNGPEGGPEFIRNRTLMDLNKEWYFEAEKQVKAWKSRDDINMATLRRFGRRWIRNLSRNMEAIRDLPGINGLEGIAADIPVFLAAGGPSLDRAGPLFPEIAKRCITVAVDTSLRYFLGMGEEPDFVLAVDPQFWNSRHLDRAPAPNTRLIAESAVYPPVLRRPFGGVFLCGSLFPLGRFVEDRVDPKGSLGAGGSVATTAWDFARRLGTPSVWTAGLDLAFPGLKTHYKGAIFEERAHGESERRVPAETWSVKALRSGGPFKAPAGTGGEVLTDRRLSLYAAWFENRFREYPAIENYRLFSEGIAIRGLESADPAALLALPERRGEITRRLEGAFSRIGAEFGKSGRVRERALRYDEARLSLRRGLTAVTAAARSGAAAAEKALSQSLSRTERGKVLKTLDEVNRSIAESEVKDVAGFLFPPMPELEAEPGVSGPEPFLRHLELSARLYRALAEAAEYNLAALFR